MKKLLSLTLVIMMLFSTISINVSASTTPSDWAVDEVNNAKNAGIITNAIMQNFQKDITREEFCELVVKLYEKLTNQSAKAGTDIFTDTDNQEILKAYNLGIVKGVSSNKFAPYNNITRQEICVMLVRCIDVAIESADISDFNNNNFADKNKISEWAIDYVNYAYDNGIMKGVGNNCIDPLGNTTCEQSVLLAYRIYSAYAQSNVAYEVEIENIETDEETDISYVNNIVIILFKDSATQEDKDEVVSAINGEVVGHFDTINQYQVQVKTSTLDELIDMCDTVNEFDCVLSSTYDIATRVSTDAMITPNDKWNNDDWNEANPGGNNWWLEVIQAPSAWSYNDKLGNIKIGIVDNGFDTGHEDLKNKLSFATEYNKDINNKEDHGSHVAGIIGATANNNKGITGIVWNSELVCFDWSPSWLQSKLGGWSTSTAIAAGLIETVKSGAKVINFSLGSSGFLENNNSTYSQEWIDAQGHTASMYMASLLSQGYDFVVVQSAGNGASDHIGVDAIYNGWFSSITRNNCYNNLNTVNDILDRIIIVGAVEQDGDSYGQRRSSNGGSQVDICAPGGKIYSTVTGGFFGDYKELSGTSMAAPMVTGVAALVWSADTSLNGAEVKRIVCDPKNTVYEVADNTQSPNAIGAFRMVNAKLAVEDALRIEQHEAELIADFSFDNTISDNANLDKIYGNGDYSFESGVNGKCIYLDGDGDYLDLGNDYQLPQNFTFNAWVKSESEDRSDAAIFAKYETNGYGPYDFYLSYNRPAFWVSNGNGGNDEYIAETTLSSNRWYMITYVKNENNLKIYVNGKLDVSVDCIDITTNNDNVTIGRQSLIFSPYSDLEYKGYIDELKIFNKALNDEEILDLFEENNYYSSENETYIEYNNHKYAFFEEDMTWEEAENYCESLGGYLATISSDEENEFLFKLMKAKGYDSAYFGFSDSSKEGVWKWANGESIEYTNWHSGEPNSENSNEDYAMFYYKFSDGTWNDGDFGGKTVNGGQVFICEWGDYSAKRTQPTSFQLFAEHSGKVYTGIDGCEGIRVGAPGTITKFCIINDYIYYYSKSYTQGFDGYYCEPMEILRTDLDGNNNVRIVRFDINPYVETVNTLTSDPYIINNNIYISVNSDDESIASEKWSTWVYCPDNDELYAFPNDSMYEGYIYTMETPSNAKYIISANNDYVFYQPYDQRQWMPPFATGFVIFDVESQEYFTVNTEEHVTSILSNDKNIYYYIDNGTKHGTYRYDITTEENIKIADFHISYLNNDVGYYVTATGDMNIIDLNTLQTKSWLSAFGTESYSGVITETENYIYLQKSSHEFYGEIFVQYDKRTGQEKFVGQYEWPN